MEKILLLSVMLLLVVELAEYMLKLSLPEVDQAVAAMEMELTLRAPLVDNQKLQVKAVMEVLVDITTQAVAVAVKEVLVEMQAVLMLPVQAV
tara:strand:- start:69 stop:344 length:276 start_codon:yes stop_codon:yes gene_type:complete